MLEITKFFTTRNVPLREFPSLFAMEGHTGAVGVFFGSFWFALVALYVPATVTRYWILAIAVIAAFFVLCWLSFSMAGYFAMKMSEPDLEINPARREKVEVQVRIGIALLSASYVVVFCILIWITGGIESPFLPLYVMTFTLTISKMIITPRTIIVSLYFLCALMLAVVAREFWPWPEATYMRQSYFQVIIQIVFICASLIIPTMSLYLVKRRTTKDLLEQMNSSYRTHSTR